MRVAISAADRYGKGVTADQLIVIELGGEFQWPMSELEYMIARAAAWACIPISEACNQLLRMASADESARAAIGDILEREMALRRWRDRLYSGLPTVFR